MFLILLSPAKTLDFEKKLDCKTTTKPLFTSESKQLIDCLLSMSKNEIGKLMSISEKLTELNYKRFKDWNEDFNIMNSRHAISCFTGDVYKGLNVDDFSIDDLEYSQNHLRILSGLYGLLRPLDLIKAYRLEMGTKLENSEGKNLYQFWNNKITESLNQDFKLTKNKYLVNLASNEYFESVKKENFKYEIITPKFLDEKKGIYKVVSFFAKKARGSMASYIIKNRIKSIADLKNFSGLGYKFSPEKSDEINLTFIR